jgi:hypothetical protein
MKYALWIALALALTGCSMKADNKLSDDATDRFYQELAAKQYAQIYQDAAPEFQAAMPADTFVRMMQRIDHKLGACQPPVKALDWHVNATTSGFFRTQGYIRACANGPLPESVTMVVRGGQAKLAGYFARSTLLLTD